VFDDPSAGGVASCLRPLPRLAYSDSVSSSPYLSEMKKSACQPVCARSLSSATGSGGRFRQRWSASSIRQQIAPIKARASLGSLADVVAQCPRRRSAIAPGGGHAGAARRAAMDLA
jgi:hypothetical protein